MVLSLGRRHREACFTQKASVSSSRTEAQLAGRSQPQQYVTGLPSDCLEVGMYGYHLSMERFSQKSQDAWLLVKNQNK